MRMIGSQKKNKQKDLKGVALQVFFCRDEFKYITVNV